ncbi:MAG: hypothetical protein NPIRA02_33620 [Nitrospirales bacterium]|nr:MAG: hypothetical protein NPIRA02_33620 [Nitrospirales bacterium]
MMKTVSFKLDDALSTKLIAVSKHSGLTQSDIVREALEIYLSVPNGLPQGSALDLAKDLVGCLTGPKDLSTNKAHLDGFGH